MFSPEERDVLYETFAPGPNDEVSFGLTEQGIWHPTPLDVLLPALEAMAREGWLGSAGRALTPLDAGSVDGRVVGALAIISGLSADTRVLGLESTATLATQSRERLERMAPSRRAQITQGDFLDMASYGALGIAPSDVDVFLNYPDGNEQALGRFVLQQAPDATLLVLSPDRRLALSGLALLGRLEIASGGPGWTAFRFAAP